MAFLHEEEDDHNTADERKEYGAEDRYLSEPQKAHHTCEFIIVAKFGDHALRHLASRLANVIRQGGRLKPYLSVYNCCIVLCTISGFSNGQSSVSEVLFIV